MAEVTNKEKAALRGRLVNGKVPAKSTQRNQNKPFETGLESRL
jgi:hypothetical protein